MRTNVLIVKLKRQFLIDNMFDLKSVTLEKIAGNIDPILPVADKDNKIEFTTKKIVDHHHALPDKKDFTKYYTEIKKNKKFPEDYYEAELNIHQWYELSFELDGKDFNIVDFLKEAGAILPLIDRDDQANLKYLAYDSVNELYSTDNIDPWYRRYQYHFKKSELEYIWKKRSEEIKKQSSTRKSQSELPPSNSPLLAVIDSGLNTNIASNETNGQNYKILYGRKEYDAYDPQGHRLYNYENWGNTSQHGTMITGILAAKQNEDDGQGNFFSSKVLDIRAFGDGSDSTIMNAIAFAVYKGTSVINCSWGPKRHQKENRLLEEVLKFAFWRKSLCVFAAGNQGNDVKGYYPASDENVIAVGALSKKDKILPRTNYGIGIDTFAYAENILSLEGIKLKSGTSVAAPQVSGLLALILSMFPRIKDEAPSPGFFIIRIKNLLKCITPGRVEPEKAPNIRPSINPIDPTARRINAREFYDYAQKYYPNPPKKKATKNSKASTSPDR